MPFHECSQKHAREEVARARRLDIPFSALSLRPSGRKIRHRPDAESSPRSTPEAVAGGGEGGQAGTRDGGGGSSVTPRKGSSWFNMNKITECRERSQSAWLHFPHVELVFLLFAFEGAVAAQVAAIRESSSPVVFILAMSCLVSLVLRKMYSG